MQRLLLALITTLIFNHTYAQIHSYPSSSGEMIFSFAKINKEGNDLESNLRWSPVFNWQVYSNHDIAQYMGFFYGFAIRNVGFIYSIQHTDSLKKFRTYNIGIPIGFKLGNIPKGFFLYGGYEFEMPFHYKEKTFVNEDKKDKIAVWFSNRTDRYTQSVFAGINFPRGANLKFKYYLNNFFNKDYTESDPLGNRIKPFASFNANVFYIALQFNPFKDFRGYYKKKQEKSKPAKSDERYSYNYR